MPHRSSNRHKTVSDEIKLLNYSNYQQPLTGQNIDDIASDILILKQKAQTEKEHISLLEAKIDHLLAGQEEVKTVIILASEKIRKKARCPRKTYVYPNHCCCTSVEGSPQIIISPCSLQNCNMRLYLI